MDKNFNTPEADRTKAIAFTAVMAALSTVLLILGSIININTIFFTALAAYLVGITYVLYGVRYSLMLIIASTVLDFIFNPNKLKVLLYLGAGAYIFLSEWSFSVLEKRPGDIRRLRRVHFLLRAVIFAVIYIPVIIFLPQLISDGNNSIGFFGALSVTSGIMGLGTVYLIAAFIVGVQGFIIFDLAYVFVKRIYGKFFRRIIRK